MNVIIGDYLSAILGTFREGSTWCLNPLPEIRSGGKTKVNRAEGNSVSVEFNLLYRVSNRFLLRLCLSCRAHTNLPLLQWHATLSPDDEEWLKTALKANLPDDEPAKTDPNHEWTIRDFGIASANVIDKHRNNPREWTFGGYASFSFSHVLFWFLGADPPPSEID